MKKIYTLLLAVTLGSAGLMKAQQDPQFTQFMYCKQAYNPAVVGTDGSICFNALYRQQWVSFPGAPKTGLFGFNMPLDVLGGMGVGFYFANDQLGFMASNSARLQAAKHFIFSNGGILSAGLDAGIFQQKINGTFIAPQTLNDPAIPSNQGSFPATNAPALNKLVPDFGFGLYFTVPNTMYVGLSTSHVSAATLKGDQKGSSGNSVGYNLTFDVARHYYIIAGYHFKFSGGDHIVTPNIKIKTDAATTQVDFNLTYMLQHQFWIGATYRLQDAIAPMLGIQDVLVKGLKIGYSYDVTLSKIKGYSSGTHEIMLGYCLKPKPAAKVQSHWNVRYFED
ncbi:MAG TPA: type IX secretion system membrane protein PorP/SprF [Bacteroidia bacterium]|jgi:type IX secretion system PorP/SprF family membrane protein|nr:type IX secretion system membrane protein PorP/SprF [Bacteroidia bacterium]